MRATYFISACLLLPNGGVNQRRAQPGRCDPRDLGDDGGDRTLVQPVGSGEGGRADLHDDRPIVLNSGKLYERKAPTALLEAFIKLIATAIDAKSPYTGGHCERVPALTMMLAEAVNETTEGPLAGFTMTDEDRYELKIAGLLHAPQGSQQWFGVFGGSFRLQLSA